MAMGGNPIDKNVLDSDMLTTVNLLVTAFRRVQQHRHFMVGFNSSPIGPGRLPWTGCKRFGPLYFLARAALLFRQAREGTIALAQQDYRLNVEQLGGELLG
jgi:hypothetical protein